MLDRNDVRSDRARGLHIRSLPWLLGAFALTGCAGWWDEVTSREFRLSGIFSARPDPLIVLRDDNDGDHRARALRALREPKQHGGTDQDQDAILQVLAESAVKEKTAPARIAAVRTLGTFKDPRAVAAIEAAYYQADQSGSNVRPVGSITPAGRFAPEAVSAIRCQAVAALGDTKNPAAVDLLVKVLRQPTAEGGDLDRPVTQDERVAAARALAGFSHYQATEALVKVLQTEKDVALRDRCHESLQLCTGKKLPPDAKAWEEVLNAAQAGQPMPEPGSRFNGARPVAAPPEAPVLTPAAARQP